MEEERHSEAYPPEHLAMLLPPKVFTNTIDINPDGPTTRRLRRTKQYRPAATASWTLTVFLLALAGCIAFMEMVRISQRSLSDYVPLSRRDVENDLGRRQTSTNTTSTYPPAGTSDAAPSSLLVLAAASSTSITVGDKEPTSLLVLAAVFSSAAATPTPTPAPVPLTASDTVSLPAPTPPAAMESSTILVGTAAPSSELSLVNVPPTATPTPVAAAASSTVLIGDPSSTSELSLVNISPTATPTPVVVGDPPGGKELTLSREFTKVDYFLAMYLPTLLTVTLQSAWTIIFAATKMMEPFYQLAKAGGARAEDSLLADYLSSGLSLTSLRSIFSGHPVMLCASIVQLLMGLVVTLAGESMTVQPTAYLPANHEPAAPEWFVNTPAIRILEALMLVVFILVFIIIVLRWKRTSGVTSDPLTILSMARLLTHPSLVGDLRSIPASATKEQVRQALAGKQYMLAHFQDEFGCQQYGVVKTVVSSCQPTAATGYTAVPNPAIPHDGNSGQSRGRGFFVVFRDVVFLLIILALFGIVLAYRNIHGNEPLNVFLNSNSFGPRFVLSGVTVLISSGWKRLEREIRLMEPYRRMARRLSPADTTVLASMNATPFTTVFVAARRKWHFVSFIAAVTVSSELLLVAIPGVPFSSAQVKLAYLISTYTSLVILAVMAIAVVAVLVRRRGNPNMPREPDTLALVWLYLCASRMGSIHRSYMLAEKDKHWEQDDDKLYWFGLSVGVDGQKRWMVDEDQHGVALHRL